jgi:shikimate dehydrogenase
MTTNFCVVGSPIEHSLSPVLHAAAYKHLGLSFSYSKKEVGSGDLASFLESGNFAGVSVTMPLKKEAFALASSHDKNAVSTGVANTLVNRAGNWSATNTDVYGISQALASVDKPKRTVVMGSGATARSALVALYGKFPETEIAIVSRTAEAGAELVSFAETVGFSARVQPDSTRVILEAELVMSLVPAGAFLKLWDEITLDNNPRNGILFDVAYNPWPSSAALAWDQARVISGIEMLIWQAIEQVQLFVTAAGQDTVIDRDLLYEVMKNAVSAK